MDKETRFGGRTRYAALAEALLDDIQSGRYPVGSLLPPETDLCREFDVSRHTVREALRRLVDLGLLSRQAGVGTTVRANRIASRYVQTGENASDLMRYVRDVNLHISGSDDVIATGNLASLIGSSEGRAWLHLTGERFMSDDPTPIALTDIWIARPYRGVADGLVTPSEPIYAMIERRYGLTTAEIRQRVEAVILTDEATGRLGVAPGAPGLRITRTYVADSGEIYETAISLHPGERFSYTSTFRVETQLPDTP
ncbi:MAG: GntR family transcriptional regulator [Pseudorhodobacter sp.]